MSARIANSAARSTALTPLFEIEPLALLQPAEVQTALQFGGMHPPVASSRSGGAALQFREGVTFDDALTTALNNIRGAHGLALHMTSSDADEMTTRSACGLAALLEVAGGAVALVHDALAKLEARAAARGTE